MASVNLRRIGSAYETVAAEYLQKQGVRIMERNYRGGHGEIDLVGWDGEYLVFFEVKQRRGGGSGMAAEAVTAAKQRSICSASDRYRYSKGIPGDTPIRYDVVAIDGEELHWIKNAFDYQGRSY